MMIAKSESLKILNLTQRSLRYSLDMDTFQSNSSKREFQLIFEYGGIKLSYWDRKIYSLFFNGVMDFLGVFFMVVERGFLFNKIE